MIFPVVNSNQQNGVSYTLGGKLKRKMTIMKEKFEVDISDQQN